MREAKEKRRAGEQEAVGGLVPSFHLMRKKLNRKKKTMIKRYTFFSLLQTKSHALEYFLFKVEILVELLYIIVFLCI